MESDRYIVLGDTILDREKIIMVYHDDKKAGQIWVKLVGVDKDQGFDGGDAIKLWRTLDPDAGWRKSD